MKAVGGFRWVSRRSRDFHGASALGFPEVSEELQGGFRATAIHEISVGFTGFLGGLEEILDILEGLRKA